MRNTLATLFRLRVANCSRQSAPYGDMHASYPRRSLYVTQIHSSRQICLKYRSHSCFERRSSVWDGCSSTHSLPNRFGCKATARQRRNSATVAYGGGYGGGNRRKPGYKKYPGEAEESRMWRSLFASPNEWWDYRNPDLKRGPKSPDFTHRHIFGKSLWMYKWGSHGVYKTLPSIDLEAELAAMDNNKQPWKKALVPPRPSEAWQDLLENPARYRDMRKAKKNPAQPDFVNVHTGFAMWISSAPYGIEDKLDSKTFASSFPKEKPKMTDAMGLPIRESESSPGVEALSDDEDEDDDTPTEDEVEEDEQSWEEMAGSKMVENLLGTFDPNLTDEEMPPQEVMSLQLMRYQRQGLAWMKKREASSTPRGGLLCDQQGLGKTVQALALIASNPCPAAALPSNDTDAEEQDAEAGVSDNGSEPPRNAVAGDAGLPIKATLVVAPKSVLPNWKREIENGSNLKVLLYAGSAREKHQDPQSLAEYDVVLASYNIILHDSSFMKNSDVNSTFRVQWWRIILDEVQNIRNWANDTTAAIALLSVQEGGRRWGLSGTPIQNSEKELFSYVNFLQYTPWNQRRHFDAQLKVSSGDQMQVFKRLQDIMQPIMLRRTKESTIDGERILNLPERLVTRHKVTMKGAEKNAYTVMRDFALAQYQNAGDESSFSVLLTILLNLRRGTGHPWLAKQFWQHLGVLDEGESLEKMKAGKSRKRGKEVATEMPEVLLKYRAGEFKPSAKMLELRKLLKLHPDEKFIVFSQWTDMLDLLGDFLEDEGVEYARLDGTMEQKQREDAIASMRDDAAKRVFLISLLAGKEGLNLQFCNRIVLMDPHFNPMVEEQAIDRAHRFGQDKAVHAHKFYVEDSVDEAIFAIQDYKLAISSSIISDTSEARSLTSENLKQIFRHLDDGGGSLSDALKG